VGLLNEASRHKVAEAVCWTSARDRVLIDVCDALHDESRIDNGLWERLSTEFNKAQILDLLMLCGWYHAISFVANGVELSLEDWAPQFANVL
jgi:hypothetical protein